MSHKAVLVKRERALQRRRDALRNAPPCPEGTAWLPVWRHGAVLSLIDAELLEYLMQWNWHVTPSTSYRVTKPKQPSVAITRNRMNGDLPRPRKIRLTWAVMGVRALFDHINGNQLDNRRSNLRIATKQENGRNSRKKRSGTRTRYKGVGIARGGKFVARIKADREQIRLGRFDTEEEAARAYDAAARRYHGEFARLNFHDGSLR